MPDPVMESHDEPLRRFMYAARATAEEGAYRAHFLDNDVRKALAVSYAAIGLMVALTIRDVPNLGSDPALMLGIVVRAVTMLITLYTIWTLKHDPTPQELDRNVLLMVVGISIGMLLVHTTPDIPPVRMVAIGTMVLMSGFIGTPLYPVALSLPSAIIILGDAVIIFSPGHDELREMAPLILVTYAFATYIAIISSSYHHRARYEAYLAFSQVKTLSGMLPICANCKRIRDDQGYYQQVETYIEARSDAEFTHGICPDCVDELYPEFGRRSSLGK